MRNARRLLAALLAVVMLIPSILVPGYAAETTGFKDVREDSWYANAVDYVSAAGYMKGTSKDAFSPGEDVTRAMFVTILSRVARAQTDNTASAFGDVAANQYYSGAIEWAAEKEIVNGVGGGLFAPYRSITRQDLAVMLYRFVNAMGYELSAGESRTYTDEAAISAYAADAVRFVTSTGLFAGYQDGSFRPKATATRAQTAVIVMRLAQLLDGQIVDPEPMPAQSFDQTSEQMQVSVNAPEGALPENTRMTVSRVTDEAALAAIAQKSGAEIFAAADITFTKDGAELEPEKAVEVQIALDGLTDIENPAVIHVRDDGSVEYVASELVSLNRSGTDKALRFSASDFSVYAVTDGGTGTFFNVTVEFYARANGSSGAWQLINKQIVRNDQLGAGKTPVSDPGVPTITDAQSFEGWFEATSDPTAAFTDADADEGQTVENINATVNAKTADATIKYYALIYDVVYITYHDQAGNVLETESNHIASGSHTLTKHFQKSYIPFKGDQEWFGWTPASNVKVVNGEMVLGDYPEYVSSAESAYYKVDGVTTYNLDFTQDNSLHVYPFVARGYWLIFDTNISANNTANRFDDSTSASYTAPKLYRAGVNTVKPANPTRTGYKFDDGTANAQWYTDPGMTRPFTFGQPLTADTTLYAKWTPDTADYYVVYWKQQATDGVNAAEKHYDYVDRVKKTATTGTPVSLSSSDTVYNVAANTEDPYYFEYSAADSTTGSVQVKGDGTTVLNVRYNRKTITFRFGPATAKYYVESSPDWSKHYVYYVKSGSTYLECRRVSSSGSYVYYTEYTGSASSGVTYYMLMNNKFCELVYDYDSGSWYINYNGSYYSTSNSDNGKVYTRSTSAPSTLYYQKYELTSATTTLRGLYGHQLDTNDWPAASSGKCWNNFDESDKSVYQYPMPLLEFVPTWQAGTTLQQDFYEQDYSTSVIKVYYYGASLSNTSYYSEKLNEGTTSKGGKWYPNESVQGFTIKGYRFASSLPAANTTWTSCTSTSEIPVDESETRNLYFAFDRNRYNLVFSSTTANGTANDTESVYYDAPLSSYENRQPINSNPGYYFDGWYADANCETPFVFSGNMPARNVMVYAKWTKIRFRVVLDYNANGEDITFPGNQADSFRLDYGEQVEESAIMAAERPGYVLLGWYYTGSDGKEHDFNFAMGAHEDMADMTYGNKKEGETDAQFAARMNGDSRTGAYQVVPNTTGDTVWSDQYDPANTASIDHRKTVDVRGKIRIYAKWRENPDGLTGVNVKYFADTDYQNYATVQEGYFNPEQSKDVWDDPYIYTNLAEAYAQAASRSFEAKEKFLYWEIVDADGNVVKTVYPGQTFRVRTSDAIKTHELKDQYKTECEHENATPVAATSEPTCTEGAHAAYWYCPDCGKYFADNNGERGEETTLEALTTQSALGHQWGTPTYTWSTNTLTYGMTDLTCTGTCVCGRDSSHTVTETVTATFVTDTPATTSAVGAGHYQATFASDAFTQQNSASVEIPKINAYVVSFSVPSGVTAPASQNVTPGNAADLTVTPTGNINGYEFIGWVANPVSETTDEVTPLSSYTPTSDATLYALYTRTEGSGDVYYELLTSAPADWSGNYVITYQATTSMYVMKGVTPSSNGASIENSANSSSYTASGVTLTDNKLYNVANSYVFTMAPHGSYYSIQSTTTGTYLGMNTDCQDMVGYTSYTSSGCDWTPGSFDNASSAMNTMPITSGTTGYPYIGFKTGSGANYFYSGSNSQNAASRNVRFWKEVNPVTTYYTTEISTYTVNFQVPDGVAPVASKVVPQGSSIDLPTAGNPEGYTFQGWVTSALTEATTDKPATLPNEPYTPSGTITLYALYSYSAPTGNKVYQLADGLEDGGKYIIVDSNSISGTTGYAVGNTSVASDHWLNAVSVTINDDTASASSVAGILWVAAAAANGYTFYNAAVGKYMGLDSRDFLYPSDTALAWAYTSNKYLDNQTDSEGYYYLSFDSTNTRYTTNKSGKVINLYQEADETALYYVTSIPDGGEAVTEPVEQLNTEVEQVAESEQAEPTRGLNNNPNPVTVSNTYWVPTTEITTTDDYLIGVKSGDDTYLLVNYNDSAAAYDYTITSTDDYYYMYLAVPSFNGSNVVGVSGAASDLSYCTWRFGTAGTGGVITNQYNTRVKLYASNYAITSNNTKFYELYQSSSNSTSFTYSPTDGTLSAKSRYLQEFTYDSTTYLAGMFTDAPSSGNIVLYKKQTDHTLTVNFTGPSDGTFVAPTTHTEQVVEGVQYSYTVPTVPGYTPTVSVVTGTMGTNDVTVTVEYTKAVESNERWEPTTQIVPGEDYLIAYVINGTPYLIVNHSEVNNADYYTITSDGTDYNMAYLAPAGLITENGIEYVKSVSGATTSLDNCHWIFSSSTGGTITSGYDSTKTLYWSGSTSNIAGVYPYTVADTWTWTPNGSGNMGSMKTTWTSTGGTTYTMYFYPRTASGAASTTATPPYAGMSQTSFTNIRLYHRVATSETTWEVRFYDEDGNAIEGIDDQTVKNGKYATEPTAPEKTDYYFLGWFKKGETTAFDFDNTAITADTDLVARYDYMYIDTYTVQLRAVYGIPNITGKTHIYWYENDGTTVSVTETVNGQSVDVSFGNGAGDRYEQNEINMNVGVDIPTPTSWRGRTDNTQDLTNREDRVFLGWARLATTGSGASGTAHPELTEKDLFLKWNGTQYQIRNKTTGKWENLPTNGSTNNQYGGQYGQVYADESTPYHDMYAVWATYAYVLHSSTGKLEAVEITYNKDGKKNTVDLTSLIDETKYLYGGYYRSYGGAADILARESSANNSMKSFKDSAMNSAYRVAYLDGTATEVLTGAETYNGSSLLTTNQATNARFWAKENAYDVSKSTEENPVYAGDRLVPTVGTVYYLKEVPKAYLPNRLVWVKADKDTTLFGNTEVKEGEITNLYLMTALDDRNYADNGFFIGKAHSEQNVTSPDGSSGSADSLSRVFIIAIKKGNTYEQHHYNAHALNNDIELPKVEPNVEPNADLVGFVAATNLGLEWIRENRKTNDGTATFYLKPYWKTLDGVTVEQNNLMGVDISTDGKSIGSVTDFN